jgi:hypothetical protein
MTSDDIWLRYRVPGARRVLSPDGHDQYSRGIGPCRKRNMLHMKLSDPFSRLYMKGLSGVVDGDHYFDTIAGDAMFEFLYKFPGWPRTIRGRAELMTAYSGYGNSIRLRSADKIASGDLRKGSMPGKTWPCIPETHRKRVQSVVHRIRAISKHKANGMIPVTLWRRRPGLF